MGNEKRRVLSSSTSSGHIIPAWLEGTSLKDSCPDQWTWNNEDKAPEVTLLGNHHRVAHFHPNWSNGTAGVRGTIPINRGGGGRGGGDDGDLGGVRYWEIILTKRLFGTSMMFGVASQRARLHVDAFVNLLGEDENSWALSHKGLLWHGGKCRPYTEPFKENETTTIGVLFDGNRGNGTLTFFKDGVCLGVAFTGLNCAAMMTLSDDDDDGTLFPAVCSTAAKTEMILGRTLRSFSSLQDRCRSVVARCVVQESDVDALPLPCKLRAYVLQSLPMVSKTLGDAEILAVQGSSAADERQEFVLRSRQLSGEFGMLFRKRVQQQIIF